MAKKKKAAPEGEAEAEGGAEGEAPAGGGKKKIIMIAAAVLVLAGGGGGYFMFAKKSASKDAAHVQEKPPVAFVDVQEMTVNLATEPGQERQRFLKLKVTLEVKDAKMVPTVQPLLPRVQDIFQVYVRELRASDLEGSGGIYRLREELLRRVNLAIFPSRADAVLFKEVVVQ